MASEGTVIKSEKRDWTMVFIIAVCARRKDLKRLKSFEIIPSLQLYRYIEEFFLNYIFNGEMVIKKYLNWK